MLQMQGNKTEAVVLTHRGQCLKKMKQIKFT